MMKKEFSKLVGKEISADDYKIIEFVYTWHPSISDIHGKEQIADLYMTYGMRVIRDMVGTATAIKDCDTEINKVRGEIAMKQMCMENLQQKRKLIKEGRM